MTHQVMLDDQEWDLVLELLQAERRELPPEIRHTDTRQYHDDLAVRLKLVDELIAKVRSAGPVQ